MKLVVLASILLQVIAVGVQTDPANLLTCVRRPGWLLRIIAAMFVAVPLLATVLAKLSDAPLVVKGAMLLLGIAAVAPMLPKKLLKLGVDPAFAESLSAVTIFLAIPLVPLTAWAIGLAFDRQITVPPGSVARTLATTFIVPFMIGMALKPVLRSRAQQFSDWAELVGDLVLVALVAALLVIQNHSIFPLLWQALPAVALFAAGSLAIGHLLGGPDPSERTALAVAAVTRHPGLAILVATSVFPDGRLLPGILTVLVGCTIASIPYSAWRKHVSYRSAGALRVRAGEPSRP
jgi:BASS family bile acid:Na+ symporter